MNNIKLLDKQTASKIAAGEVIERPAGVLKELIENSLDAGATIINIDIEHAGKKLIRVNDNGTGITAEDLPLTILRHTTSKINNFDDLNTLNTFGFRGEALFSVSAISKISIASCTAEGSGNIIQAEAGTVTLNTQAPAIQGTTVEVKELFFNTPARLKFLKSDTVERSHLLRCAEEALIANPQVAFNIKTDGTKVYALSAQNDDEQGLRKRLAKILGEETTDKLVYAEDSRFGFKALISSSEGLCAARDQQYFFINKRPVNCKILQQAVYKAYQPYRAKEKHPIIVLFMQMPPDEFDVNIHPQKKDIKFINEPEIFNFVCNIITQSVLKNADTAGLTLPNGAPVPALSTQTQDLSQTLNENAQTVKNLFEARDFEEPKKYTVIQTQEEISYPRNTPVAEQKPQELKQEEATDNNPAWWKPPYNYLGQLHRSYLLFENPEGLILVDQHAAQERIFFEEYMASLKAGTTKVQPLMFPVSAELPASDIESIMAWQDIMAEAGFEISRFSPRTLLVNTTPNLLKFKEEDLRDFIVQIAGVLGDPAKSSADLKHKLISTMACKKSIKAGELLEKTQADALMRNLKKCEDGMHCPHGRPTVTALGIKEIAKKFGRI